MHIRISNTADLGHVIRAARKAQGLRLDDAAAFAGVGTVFAGDVERGKPTVQLGRVLRLLEQLGLRLIIDAPDAITAAQTRKRPVPKLVPKRA